MTNATRIGNFTSSEIAALMSEPTDAAKKKGALWGKPATTYIAECNFERKLGRSITDESSAKPLTWGTLLEKRVLEDLLGTEYRPCSKDTIRHPEIECWAGSPDAEKDEDERTVVDIKSPMTLKSFCQLVEPIYLGLTGIEAINHIRENHKDGDKYYWQLTSNAILINAKYAELIVYVPYFSELNEIRALAQQVDAEVLHKHYWIANAGNDEIPFLIDGGYYKNLNVIRWEVSESDKAALTERVKIASSLLIEVPSSMKNLLKTA